jgi:hypothetical protein
MGKTGYRVGGSTLICLFASLGSLAPIVRAQQPASRITLTGCLVSESEYASAKGLAAPAQNSRESQLVVVLAPSDSRPRGGDNGPAAYALTGTQEARLSASVHHRVSLEGMIESTVADVSAPAPQPGGPGTPAGAVGTTPDGSPAHEPADAIDAPRREVPLRRPGERVASVTELDRINVVSARVMSESCRGVDVPAATAVASGPADRRPAAASTPPSVTPQHAAASTLTGCLVPRDAGPDAIDVLTLLAVPADDRPSLTRGAVPGSLPSGAGTGTVGTSPAAAAAAPGEAVAYRLTGDIAALRTHVGQRVEVTGIIDAGAVPARVTSVAPGSRDESTAHPTAVQHTLAVTSFRVVGGVCR